MKKTRSKAPLPLGGTKRVVRQARDNEEIRKQSATLPQGLVAHTEYKRIGIALAEAMGYRLDEVEPISTTAALTTAGLAAGSAGLKLAKLPFKFAGGVARLGAKVLGGATRRVVGGAERLATPEGTPQRIHAPTPVPSQATIPKPKRDRLGNVIKLAQAAATRNPRALAASTEYDNTYVNTLLETESKKTKKDDDDKPKKPKSYADYLREREALKKYQERRRGDIGTRLRR